MTSDKQRDANRRNALRSTGPRSEEGKQKVRRNALKHGLTARRDFKFSDLGAAGPPFSVAGAGGQEPRETLALIGRYRRMQLEKMLAVIREADSPEGIAAAVIRVVRQLDRLKRYEANAHAMLKKVAAGRD